jgi:hypothetical protein
MFFKKATPARELAIELASYSQQLGHSTITTILRVSGKTDQISIAAANGHVDDFCTIWPIATAVAGERYKQGASRQLSALACEVMAEKLTAFLDSPTRATEIINEVGDVDGKFGLITKRLFVAVCPEVDISAAVIPGANFITCMNYADYLVRENKVSW